MTPEERLREVLDAPLGSELPAPDVRVIERPGWYQVIRPDQRDGSSNEVIRSRLAPAEADSVINKITNEYNALGVSFKWIVGPGTEPADMGERLRARGFSSWRAKGMCAPTSLALRATGALTTEEVDARTLDDFVRVMAEGWQADRAMARTDAVATLASPIHHAFMVRSRGVPIAAAGSILRARSAYLVGAVVLPEHRGVGAYRALLAARLSHARAHGRELATTWARATTSAPILEQLGFETVCTFDVYKSP